MYHVPMILLPRDRAVIAQLRYFGQLTARQIQALVFPLNESNTPCNRTLSRLLKFGLVRRLEHRIVGGAHGGSGQYVYVLSDAGMSHAGVNGRYRQRTVNFHALAVADVYCQLNGKGKLYLEDEGWEQIAGIHLRPDLRIDIGADVYWIEVDMGTEGQKQLRGKLEAYWRAWDGADVEQWPHWPIVLWVAVDQARANEIAWLITQMPKNAQPMFKVTTLDGLWTTLTDSP